MRKPDRRFVPSAAGAALAPFLAVSLAAILLVAVALPVLAKEGLQARLDAPIGRDTPAGTTLLVGMMVTVPDGATSHPVEGSPIYLKLLGRDGSSTREAGDVDTVRGHYTMRILVPAGGIAGIEVGMHGTTDLPITVVGSPLVAGGVTAATAQVAPALPPAATPFTPASVGAVASPIAVAIPAPSAATVPAPLSVAVPASAPAAAPLPGAPVVAVLAGLAVAAGLLLLLARRRLLARRTRAGGQSAAPGRAPGA